MMREEETKQEEKEGADEMKRRREEEKKKKQKNRKMSVTVSQSALPAWVTASQRHHTTVLPSSRCNSIVLYFIVSYAVWLV
jgi:hypothetical protein